MTTTAEDLFAHSACMGVLVRHIHRCQTSKCLVWGGAGAVCTAFALASMLLLPVWQVLRGRRNAFCKGGHWCSSLEKLELVCIALVASDVRFAPQYAEFCVSMDSTATAFALSEG